MSNNSEKPNNENQPHAEAKNDGSLSVETIKNLFTKYPEIGWLTGNVDTTPEASISDQIEGTIGEHIFPNLDKKDLIEFNRTAVGILALLWVVNGDYENFTACQKGPTKLTSEGFAKLQQYTKSILQNPEDLEAMEIFMVINDLGKIRGVVENIAEKSGVRDIDHDKMLLVGLEQHPGISPSFQKLSPRHKELILNGLNTKFNIGQFIQGENVPASLEGLEGIDEESLNFYLLHALYDIAGAAGQSVQNGSAVMNEPTYENFRLAIESLEKLGAGQTPDEVYDAFLAQKAEEFGFDISLPADRAITRICCMLRTSNTERAREISQVFTELSQNTRAILEDGLNMKGTDDGIAILIYYAPAFLANLQKKFSESGKPNSFKKALAFGLETFARVFQEARILNKGEEGMGVYTVMASPLAKMATENPEKLLEQEIRLKSVGNDAEIELVDVPTVDKEKFTKIENLAEIFGKKIVVVGVGGGSDCVQAAILTELLQKSGNDCPCVISIRTEKIGSQSVTGTVGEIRSVENHGGEINKGVYLITPETTGSGRFLENILANDIPVYLIVEQEGISLSEQIDSVLIQVGSVDTIVAVDTGGDALYSTTGHDETMATPDQDLRSLQAISSLTGIQKISCEIAVGVDSPPNGESVLLDADAKYYEPTPDETALILEKYREWQMDGTNEARFGKTPLAWQEALQGHFGFKEVNLPTRVVLDKKNPWNPFVHVQPSTKGMFFMDVEKHLKSIER